MSRRFCAALVAFSLTISLLTPLEVVAGHARHFMTENFTAPVVSVTKHGPIAPGLLFLSPGQGGSFDAPTIIDSSGELVWRSPNSSESSNFDSQMIAGTSYLTWWSGWRDRNIGTGYGGVHIYNSSYSLAYFVCGAALDINPLFFHPNTSCQIDPHESRITDRGTILVTARSVVKADLSEIGGPENGWVLDNIFYELDILNERVITRWSAFEHRKDYSGFLLTDLPLDHGYSSPRGSTPYRPWDFFHMDSVVDVPSVGNGPNGFLISSRYISAIIKIDNAGETEWYFTGSGAGNFNVAPSANFSFQHDVDARNATTTTMTISMFDDGNYAATVPQQPSAGLLLHVDLIEKEVTMLQRLEPDRFIASTKMGSYMALPYKDHVLIDFGYPAQMNEFDANGNVVWKATLPGVNTTIYRAYKKPWTGTPTSIPKAFALYDGKYTNVWTSWNGDTEVQHWEIYGRKNKKDAMDYIGRVSRSGFETLAPVKGKFMEVLVVGRDHEKSLGTTEIVEVREKLVPIGSLQTPPPASASGKTNGQGKEGKVFVIAMAAFATGLCLLL